MVINQIRYCRAAAAAAATRCTCEIMLEDHRKTG